MEHLGFGGWGLGLAGVWGVVFRVFWGSSVKGLGFGIRF